MRKSRLMIVLATAIIFAGLSLGILAYISAPGTSARASTLPDAAAWMPSSADLVLYVDLAAVLSSPLHEEWEAHLQERTLSEVDEFRAKTGLDPFTDFRAMALSTRQTDEGGEWGLALTGDLSPKALISAIGEKETLEQKTYENTILYIFEGRGDRGKPRALAFPTPSMALFGSPNYVQNMLDVGTGRLTSAVEGPLAGWINDLPLDDTFWCVGSSGVGFTRFMPPPNRKAPRLPPLQSFAISGSLSSEFSMIARGKASGPEDAQKLADVVRGFIALGSLRQESQPEIQAVLDSVQIGVIENKIEISMEVPYETLRRLASRHWEADR